SANANGFLCHSGYWSIRTIAAVVRYGEYQVVPTQSTYFAPGQKKRGWFLGISGLPNDSGTHMSATGARGSMSMLVRTLAMWRRRSLRLSTASGPPRTISAMRRHARMNCLTEYAGPRGRPIRSYGEYGLFPLFISESGRRYVTTAAAKIISLSPMRNASPSPCAMSRGVSRVCSGDTDRSTAASSAFASANRNDSQWKAESLAFQEMK